MKTNNEIAVERATKIIESIKRDIADYEKLTNPEDYRVKTLPKLREQLVKREAILAELTK